MLRILKKMNAGQKPTPTVTAKKTPAPSFGNYQKGLNAYNKEDYATVLREWILLPNRAK